MPEIKKHDNSVALTIAGSDSGAGAGIQADLRTFEALGVPGASAITCVTAQSPVRVTAIHPVAAEVVFEQISVVCSDFRVLAVKTGMLYSREIIQAVASALRQYAAGSAVVVDPVMVATSGARLLLDDAVSAMQEDLFPVASIVTPNIPEAEILRGKTIASSEDAGQAAKDISAKFGISCVVKGGHLAEQDIVRNVLCHDNRLETFVSRRVHGASTHGTGCVFSSALAAFIAKGVDVRESVEKAGMFVAGMLEERAKPDSGR